MNEWINNESIPTPFTCWWVFLIIIIQPFWFFSFHLSFFASFASFASFAFFCSQCCCTQLILFFFFFRSFSLDVCLYDQSYSVIGDQTDLLIFNPEGGMPSEFGEEENLVWLRVSLFIYLFIYLFFFFFFFFFFCCCFCCFCFSSSPFFPSLPPFIILASQNHQKKTLFSLRLRLHWYHFCQPCDPFLLIWRGLSLLHLHLHLLLFNIYFFVFPFPWPNTGESNCLHLLPHFVIIIIINFYLLQLWIDPQNSNKMRWLNDLSGIYSYPPDK